MVKKLNLLTWAIRLIFSDTVTNDDYGLQKVKKNPVWSIAFLTLFGILQLICLACINCHTHFYLAIKVVIPTQDSILTMESITFPNVNLSSFGNITSMFEIPSAVILNQIKMEGAYIVCFVPITVICIQQFFLIITTCVTFSHLHYMKSKSFV